MTLALLFWLLMLLWLVAEVGLVAPPWVPENRYAFGGWLLLFVLLLLLGVAAYGSPVKG